MTLLGNIHLSLLMTLLDFAGHSRLWVAKAPMSTPGHRNACVLVFLECRKEGSCYIFLKMDFFPGSLN